MQNYYKHLLLLAKRLIIIMLLLSVTRLLFYIFNYSFFESLSIGQVLLHFVYGLRFDMATVFLFNLFYILFSVLPYSILSLNGYQRFLKIFFIAVSSFLVALNLVDTKFYEFEGKRLTGDIFSKEWLGNDFFTLLPEFMRDYWYLFLFFLGFVFLLIKIYPAYHRGEVTLPKASLLKYVRQVVLGVIVLIVSVYAGRGGVQLKPIGIIAAARYTTPEYMALVLNSPFTLVKTFGDKSLPIPEYYTAQELDSVYSPVHKFNSPSKFRAKNVVVLILESFGREYSGYLNDTIGYTPKFDSIMQLGLTFNNAYANGKRSIEALPSIFSGLPALMDNALVNTKYSSNLIEGIGSILDKKGYATSFYHGGKNGTMGFDNYVKLVGVKEYLGMDEYVNKDDYDGNWGVFDEPYLQYVAHELTSVKEPFFSSVFTLSSHHPYTIPEKHTNRFPKGELVNLESIGYADYALGEFFKTASKQPWFNNTLFVLTADHTAQTMSSFYKSKRGMYAVPLVFYAPGDSRLKGVSTRVCQQADVLPSVLDYLHYNEPFIAYGNSVFSNDTNSFAVSYLSGIYQLITNSVAISFDGATIVDTEIINSDTTQSESIRYLDSINVINAESQLKGIIQQYNYRMEHNLMKVQ